MVEGKVSIYLSHKEPDKNILWLRPYLDRDGYELLYWGAMGWTPLINCPFQLPEKRHCTTPTGCAKKPKMKKEDLECVNEVKDCESDSPPVNLPEPLQPPCRCQG